MKFYTMLATLIVYILVYNNYFGNHWLPQSDAEVICDGISFLGLLYIINHYDWS